jgi:hypothetical protein
VAFTEPITNDRLARKVDWEGGIIATLDYGIRSEQIADPEVAAMWHEAETIYDKLAPVLVELDRRMRDAA